MRAIPGNMGKERARAPSLFRNMNFAGYGAGGVDYTVRASANWLLYSSW